MLICKFIAIGVLSQHATVRTETVALLVCVSSFISWDGIGSRSDRNGSREGIESRSSIPRQLKGKRNKS